MKRTPIRRVGKRALEEKDELKAFRAAVLARDNWSCRRCGDESGLQVHHRLPRSRGGKHEPENGVAVCASCHRLIHSHQTPDWMDWIS